MTPEKVAKMFGTELVEVFKYKSILKSDGNIVLKVQKGNDDLIVKAVINNDVIYSADNEIYALTVLSDMDNFPKLKDQKKDEKYTYILKDYVTGETMFSFMRQRNYKNVKNDVINNINDVVERIHSRGLAFLDIHDINVLIKPDSLKIKLYDFDTCITEKRRYFQAAKIVDLEQIKTYFGEKNDT